MFFFSTGTFFLTLLSLEFALANYYVDDIFFTIPDTVYTTGERIEIRGYLYQANYSNNGTVVSNSAALANVTINITMTVRNGTFHSNYTPTTDANGSFYSRSNYYPGAVLINAPSTAGNYYIRAVYITPDNATWFSEVEINVVNKTLDLLRASTERAVYNPSETLMIKAEAVRLINDKIIYVSNVSINGSIRNSTKDSLTSFNCTTENNGKCSVSATSPSSYGNYIVEIGGFKAFSSFIVVPFSFNIYMKDGLGKSLKNIFAVGEEARVEVGITNASSSDLYTFSGYIADSSGNVVKTVDSTQLNSNNSFTNSFLFGLDSLTFSYGPYRVYLTITKSGDGSVPAYASFEVQDWGLSINKRTVNSGFEYEYSVFPNKTMRFEAYPTVRSNGSIIGGINSSFFEISIKDNLNNIIFSTNAVWNASCEKSGCYEFSLNSPSNLGKYTLHVTLAYGGSIQTETQIINVINTVMSAQSTDKDGNIKELFGTNEFDYITLSAYNLTSSQINLSDAEIFLITYMNGSEFSYTQVNNFELVNSSNSAYEWAWNSTLQRIKLDVPRGGGLYDVFLFGNNRTTGANAKFIVNPYDSCIVTKDSATSSGGSGMRYVWQFKTTDTVYFEIKLTQANNPLGRATALNSSGNSSVYGMSSACATDTTKQGVTNATLTIVEVRNAESGALQGFNLSESVCQSDDNSGGYTCTVKPLTKWDGGVSIVKLNIVGQDSTSSIAYGRFEARSFYLYGWSQTWQNSPTNNITLNVQLYEAGNNWWSTSGSSGGISGTVTVKKIEYQGRDGEWFWPPVDSGYNASQTNSSSISSGSGTISLPAQYAPGGKWKTGYYRVILQGTTSSGDTDYGYAWFGIKLWDVYGQPVECLSTGCSYKNYFNSKENITLYVKISQAGAYNYYDAGGASLGETVTIGVKKIQDCRKWPCKDLNSSQYAASSIAVNQSSPWYWNANNQNQSKYLIQINTTTGSWGTGYYSVVLDVNGTDTGYAWFNTLAFYVETQPTNSNGSGYKYSIRGNSPIYFNVTTTKSYKWGYWYNNSFVRYNQTDYLNATVNDIVLRTWDSQTYQSKEYNYPEEINVTPLAVNGNGVINVTFRNGTWPTGYYWGELNLLNSENDSSTGWLWFNVQPFRVQINSNTYSVDSDQCINTTIAVYDPDWSSNSVLYGNYSITSINENIWGGSGSSKISYTNYTSGSFNATANATFCPNNGSWGGGSWGGYHYLNVVVKDNLVNDTQTGWLSFKAVPFQISWGSIQGGTSKLTNQNVVVPATLTKPLSGASTSGRLTKLYQWRYDNYRSTKEEYVFSVGSCYSNVSGYCTVNGTQNVTIYPPITGWKIGYNYIYSVWTTADGSSGFEDWSGIYIEGREIYGGSFENVDSNGNWKYNFMPNEKITIRLVTQNSSYNAVNLTITNVQYAYSGNSCWSEWCRSYTDATWSLIGGGTSTNSQGRAIITINAPSGGWTKGYYYIKASVSGSGGTATITNGNVRVKDLTAPNITIAAPANNGTYNLSSLQVNFTTTENSQCSVYLVNYGNFYNWYCNDWNSTSSNSTNASAQTIGACNTTLYNYTGNTYYTEYVSSNYRSSYDGSNSTWSSGSTGLTTGGTTHRYTYALSGRTAQYYGIQIWCYDEDDNYASAIAAFKLVS